MSFYRAETYDPFTPKVELLAAHRFAEVDAQSTGLSENTWLRIATMLFKDKKMDTEILRYLLSKGLPVAKFAHEMIEWLPLSFRKNDTFTDAAAVLGQLFNAGLTVSDLTEKDFTVLFATGKNDHSELRAVVYSQGIPDQKTLMYIWYWLFSMAFNLLTSITDGGPKILAMIDELKFHHWIPSQDGVFMDLEFWPEMIAALREQRFPFQPQPAFMKYTPNREMRVALLRAITSLGFDRRVEGILARRRLGISQAEDEADLEAGTIIVSGDKPNRILFRGGDVIAVEEHGTFVRV